MRRVASSARRVLFGAALLASVVGGASAETWSEDFASGRLDPARWQRTLDGDFRMQSAEVVASDAGAGFRLRLVADTLGTRDDAIKHVGVRSRCAISLGSEASLRLTIDWGPPANGSYMAAAVVLSSQAVANDPTTTRDWLSVGYVGVPPGRNARLLVTASAGGVVRTLYADGWPDGNRLGRSIKRAEIDLTWRRSTLEIRENGQLVHTATATGALFNSAHIYFQLSSHSNYPARAVHFENLRVRHGDEASTVTGFPSAPDCYAARAK
jgi:hypothetical protein